MVGEMGISMASIGRNLVAEISAVAVAIKKKEQGRIN